MFPFGHPQQVVLRRSDWQVDYTPSCEVYALHLSDDQKKSGGNHNGYHGFIRLFLSFLDPVYHYFLLLLFRLQCHNTSFIKA